MICILTVMKFYYKNILIIRRYCNSDIAFSISGTGCLHYIRFILDDYFRIICSKQALVDRCQKGLTMGCRFTPTQTLNVVDLSTFRFEPQNFEQGIMNIEVMEDLVKLHNS